MRRPSTTIVIDAAILVATVRGRSVGAILKAAGSAILVTTDRAVQEVRRRIGSTGERRAFGHLPRNGLAIRNPSSSFMPCCMSSDQRVSQPASSAEAAIIES